VADVDGGWERVELERNFEWSVMPYISGVLVKKGVPRIIPNDLIDASETVIETELTI
jgi:hypothetical protein